jgi:P27 family predicted phage terminase small subunit
VITVSIPDPPVGTRPWARRRWEAFWRSEAAKLVDLDADLNRLHRWIQQVDQYDAVVEELGTAWTVRGSMGGEVLNPLVRVMGQLETQLARTESEFGMTPLGRKRLLFTVEGEQQADDPLDELAKRRNDKAASA